MIRVTRRPTDPEFHRFADWRQRANAARDRLIQAWVEAGQPIAWQSDINEELYKEFRDVFLYEAFYLKCAYCESKLGHQYPVQVEHYRPKRRLTDGGERGHPGYFWLAYEWWNLLPACHHCNTWHTDPLSKERSPGKSSEFPIQGTRVCEPSADPDRWQEELAGEDPLLLNPYFQDPAEHIDFDAETGVPIPRSPYGRATIKFCDLTREALCERRRRAGTQVFRIANDLIEGRGSIDSLIPESEEYSLWLKRLLQRRLAMACIAAGMLAPQRASALDDPLTA